MANFIYGKAKESLLKGQINLLQNDLKVLLVNQSYIPSVNDDEFVSHISSSYIKNRSNNLTNVSVTLGTIDAEDITISDHDGSAFKAIVLYQVGTSDADSRLISYIDTSSGLPFEGTSFNLPVTIVWNNSSTKIISI